jgi:hypothetical protein
MTENFTEISLKFAHSKKIDSKKEPKKIQQTRSEKRIQFK